MSSLLPSNQCWIRRSFAAVLCLLAMSRIQAELVTLNDDTFEHQTQASTGATTGSWFLMLGATEECTPCDQMKPLLEELGDDEQLYGNGIVVGTVDVKTSPNTATRFGIETIPSFLYLHKKKLYRFPSDVPRSVESMKEFVLEHYSKVAAEEIPPPPSAMDHVMNLWKKLQESGMILYAFAIMAFLLLGTIGVLIMTLLGGRSKTTAAKKD